jgi:DNA-binding protein H-NS
MDLSRYNSSELQQLKKDIDKELTQRRKQEAKQAQQELKEVAEKYGFSLSELVPSSAAKGTRSTSTGTIRFRHPQDPSKTWSGRGRKPVWVKEWEAAGRSLDEARVSG